VPRSRLDGFVEANGYVSMEADDFTGVVDTRSVSWKRIPDIGRTGSGMEPFPVTASARGQAAAARGWSTS